jgi:hypothetical protein
VLQFSKKANFSNNPAGNQIAPNWTAQLPPPAPPPWKALSWSCGAANGSDLRAVWTWPSAGASPFPFAFVFAAGGALAAMPIRRFDLIQLSSILNREGDPAFYLIRTSSPLFFFYKTKKQNAGTPAGASFFFFFRYYCREGLVEEVSLQ